MSIDAVESVEAIPLQLPLRRPVAFSTRRLTSCSFVVVGVTTLGTPSRSQWEGRPTLPSAEIGSRAGSRDAPQCLSQTQIVRVS